jgi:hypothetical protein
MNKYKVAYWHCPRCGFLQTEEPYWLDDAKCDALNIYDTGIISRAISFSRITAGLIYFLFDTQGKFVDYAGGYGLFTRMMRDIGFDYYWYDPYAQNLFARSFEFKKNMQPVTLVTAFECFEHFVDPQQSIAELFAISPNIFFSTTLLPVPCPKPQKWWYYGLQHGQHICFYARSTLEFIAKQYKVNLYTNSSNLHLFTKKQLPQYIFPWFIRLSRFLIYYITMRLKPKTYADMKLLEERKVAER